MIKKLRLQFILVSMVAIFFVMSATLMTINFSNFYAIENSTRKQLNQMIKEGVKSFPTEGEDPPKPDERPKDYTYEDYIYAVIDENEHFEELVYKFPINEQDKIETIALTYYAKTKNYDKIGSYRYKKVKKESKTTLVIIDVYRQRSQAFVSMWGSFIVGGVAYSLILLLILGMSRIVLRVNEKAYRNKK